MLMNLLSYYVSFIPIIIFLVEIIVLMGLPKRLSPLITVILSISIGIVFFNTNSVYISILLGIMLASSCIGFYSGFKNIYQYFSK